MAALVAASAGCSSPAPQITIEAPYAELSPVFIGACSVYLKIRNDGGRDTLTGAAVVIPHSVTELHDVKDNRMVRIGKIAVPSRDVVELKPASLHIMVFNMPKTVQKGAELELALRFERAGEKKVLVRLQR